MQVISTHDMADFDGTAAMLAAHRLYPSATPVLPPRMGRGVREFLALYEKALPFVRWKEFRAGEISHVILVDTQKAPVFKRMRHDCTLHIIDHHPLEVELNTQTTFTGELVGATTTLLIEELRERKIPLTSLEATLLLLGIYSDTGSLTYGTTTPRDLWAAAWLLERGAVLDTVRSFLAPPLTDQQNALFDQVVRTAENRVVQGYEIVVATGITATYVENVNSVAHRLRELLDPDALFLLVQMPDHARGANVQMVCRSRRDAIDVGVIARHFGGGGHQRAAAANIGEPLADTARALWSVLEESVQPMVRIADLMSFGVQTVDAHAKIGAIIVNLRKIGHEGYPVLDGGRVIGLLTTRDADRAMEHGLRESPIRDVMSAGEITLSPQDGVAALERLIVESGWGQIPVVEAGQLVGIVTRTDLITHWAAVHPAEAGAAGGMVTITLERIETTLGAAIARLIAFVAEFAQGRGQNVYMVGGVVRDLFLERPNDDIDFVIEADLAQGNAITFAEAIRARVGGKISSYQPFGTATWALDEDVARALDVALAELPATIDFATARNEIYVHPTALPSVYEGSIKLDLHRRDFTINTLAVLLSPSAYRLLDFYGGLRDLRDAKIRALHSLSFVDDPTRVLRAARFEHRLGFEIEPRTLELIERSRPMLRRITGERLRNEFKLLLDESEPERALLRLGERGILSGIHPDWDFSAAVAADFREARATQSAWPIQPSKTRHIYWVLLMMRLNPVAIPDLARRLLFSQSFSKSFLDAATLHHDPSLLDDPAAKVSVLTRHFDTIKDLALLALWIGGTSARRARIEAYLNQWAHIKPTVDGHTLKARGLVPGPAFRRILDHLRDAWLDGEVRDLREEEAVLAALIANAQDDDRLEE